MKAASWYREFRKRFDPDKNPAVEKAYQGRELEISEWTQMIREFLEGMAAELDYRVNLEKSSFGSRRFDMKWEGDDSTDEIFIEYENDYSGIFEEEIPKLLDASGNLKILITYVPLKKYPGEDMADRLLQLLRTRKKGQAFEFLLIVGTQDMEHHTDWIAYEFLPSFESRVIIVPSRLPHS